MARPSPAYEPRSPGHSVLYQLVHDHFETFLAQAASLREGDGLPRFVEHAFREFLRCGWLAGGFARFRCDGCGTDRLVPFSCKGRALCPSCGGRRMSDRAAHLVDHVFPNVPVRQWVLSLPFPLRYLLAWDHDLCRAVAGVFVRAVCRLMRDRAREAGVPVGVEARGGAVAVIQRFGGALNLNVHIHALVLDGVFARDDRGTLGFHATRHLTALDVQEVLATVEPLVHRRLRRLGHADGDDGVEAVDGWADEAPVLAGLAAASVRGVTALGARRGRRPVRFGTPREATEASAEGRCHARVNGFDLHADLVVGTGQRERLERLCRYVLRPPVATERLTSTEDGQVRLTLKQPWRDGTTALVFDPIELLGRLAVLVPRPRINLLLYYGVLGARSAWRAEVVARDKRDDGVRDGVSAADGERVSEPPHAARVEHRVRGLRWAALMQRTFGFDVLACPRCGGRLRLIALIEQAAVIDRILGHLGVPTEIPIPRPARAPPLGAEGPTDDGGEGLDVAVFTPCC